MSCNSIRNGVKISIQNKDSERIVHSKQKGPYVSVAVRQCIIGIAYWNKNQQHRKKHAYSENLYRRKNPFCPLPGLEQVQRANEAANPDKEGQRRKCCKKDMFVHFDNSFLCISIGEMTDVNVGHFHD